jgi:hypothetical protein
MAPPMYKDVPLATDKVVFEYSTCAKTLLHKPKQHKLDKIITFEFIRIFLEFYNIK